MSNNETKETLLNKQLECLGNGAQTIIGFVDSSQNEGSDEDVQLTFLAEGARAILGFVESLQDCTPEESIKNAPAEMVIPMLCSQLARLFENAYDYCESKKDAAKAAEFINHGINACDEGIVLCDSVDWSNGLPILNATKDDLTKKKGTPLKDVLRKDPE